MLPFPGSRNIEMVVLSTRTTIIKIRQKETLNRDVRSPATLVYSVLNIMESQSKRSHSLKKQCFSLTAQVGLINSYLLTLNS
jgi:hypothetical protein